MSFQPIQVIVIPAVLAKVAVQGFARVINMTEGIVYVTNKKIEERLYNTFHQFLIENFDEACPVGATNRKASHENILELERQRMNISFDQEANREVALNSLDISLLEARFSQTGKVLD